MPETVPARFRCREHDLDLTSGVLAAVEADPTIVAGFGHRHGAAEDVRTFRVAVRCPGGDAHDLVFRGTYRLT
ncbi:MAG: hypothetical protein ABJA87_03690 [bacterium]